MIPLGRSGGSHDTRMDSADITKALTDVGASGTIKERKNMMKLSEELLRQPKVEESKNPPNILQSHSTLPCFLNKTGNCWKNNTSTKVLAEI